MQKFEAKEIADIYDEFGEQYHESRQQASGRLFNEHIDMPTVFSLLPDELVGMRVLDAGCGSGLYANELARRGCVCCRH